MSASRTVLLKAYKAEGIPIDDEENEASTREEAGYFYGLVCVALGKGGAR